MYFKARITGNTSASLLLFAVALCLCMLLIFAGCGSNQGQGQQPSSFTLQGGTQVFTTIPGALGNVHMLSTTVGWATTQDLTNGESDTILRTDDGGVHWRATLKCISTQEVGKGFMEPCSTDFHSASVATVVQPEDDLKTQVSHIRVFHTADGGATWQSSLFMARALETPATFIDAQHGWVLLTEGFSGPDLGSSYIGQEIALYSTSDGGTTWQRVAHGPATSQLAGTSDDAYGTAPLTANARMAFSSSTTGWLAGFTAQANGAGSNWLYITHDGGASWQQASLSLASAAYRAPTFFTSQNGVLAISVYGANAVTGMFYTTHNGGQSWSATMTPFDLSSGGFSDMNHAWAPTSQVTDKYIYLTSDGWRHWTKLPVHTSFMRVYGYSFVSPTTGWALADSQMRFFPAPGGGKRKGDIIALLRTTDGGQSWQEIARSQV